MKSIKSKIIITIVCLMVISLISVGLVGVILNIQSTNDSINQTMLEIAKVAAERVEQELTAYKNIAYECGSIARLADPDRDPADKKAIIDQRVSTYGLQRGNIIWADGISIFDGKDYSDREYFQVSMTGEPFISEPLISKITGELSIVISAPLWEGGIPNTKVVGVVYFVPKETFLSDIVSGIKVSEGSYTYIINQEGYTIADPDISLVAVENIEEIAKTTDPSLQGLADIHVRMRAGETGIGQYTKDGISKYAAFAPINGTAGWALDVIAEKGDFMGSTYMGIIIMVAIVALALIAAVIVSIRIGRNIGNPIKECSERLVALSKGDLTSEVPSYTANDETGVLSEATDAIVKTINGIILDIDWALGEMAKGDFTVDSKAKELYVGDFASLAKSMYKILGALTGTLIQINQAADQVAAGSDQVSSGAQALSQGATEQASSVEELAASISEITAKAESATENAHHASLKSRESASELEQGKQQMGLMVDAMEEISSTSGEIGKIIKTIEDIAFQTNILALNAAVEAARAGAAGKGFAVVADEVRNLASKSAEASKNTSTLIENSLSAVEKGRKIAESTANSLDNIVAISEETSSLVHILSKNSIEQTTSMQQMTGGVDQISAVVQTNSATAEESAAASEELSAQAQTLKDLIGNFKLRESAEVFNEVLKNFQ